MTVILDDASGRSAWRVLVLGQSEPVLETVANELDALGYQVSGSVHPETATAAFDAGDFDLIAFGGGVPDTARSQAKQTFAQRNPAVRLLDTYAPAAVRQIAERLDGGAGIDEVNLTAYFARVGFRGIPAADLPTLGALHELHPAAIPFEAFDVMMGRGIDSRRPRSTPSSSTDGGVATASSRTGCSGACWQRSAFRSTGSRPGFGGIDPPGRRPPPARTWRSRSSSTACPGWPMSASAPACR
jgi:hypothetical protein